MSRFGRAQKPPNTNCATSRKNSGASFWAGIDVLLIGARAADVMELTEFDEGPLPADWRGELERRISEMAKANTLRENRHVSNDLIMARVARIAANTSPSCPSSPISSRGGVTGANGGSRSSSWPGRPTTSQRSATSSSPATS